MLQVQARPSPARQSVKFLRDLGERGEPVSPFYFSHRGQAERTDYLRSLSQVLRNGILGKWRTSTPHSEKRTYQDLASGAGDWTGRPRVDLRRGLDESTFPKRHQDTKPTCRSRVV
jgi:hypothetical protein